MMQCPNCGGFKTRRRRLSVDPRTGSEGFGCGFVIILPPAFAIFAAVLAWVAAGKTPCSEVNCMMGNPQYEPSWLIPMAAGFVIGEVVGFILMYLGELKRVPAEAGECDLCGYKWVQRLDRPPPKATVRPDLIAKGAERLRREREKEEERRRLD